MNYLPYLIWFFSSVTLFVGTFIFYLAVLKLRDSQDMIWRAHWSVRWLGFSILFVGLVLDTLLNWVVMTVLFYEFPQEFLTTARVIRHKKHSNGFRQMQAIWWCKHWLVPFDEAHCS